MIDKFMSLKQDKRDRIINAALEEFAQKGYKNASTNEIVKKARISKGLLFHYFKNKKCLFLFLCDYAEGIFLNEFYSRLDYGETDLIRRWKQIALLKIELIRKYAALYDFILTSVTEDSMEIKQELESRHRSIYEEAFKRLFENIDTSGLKDGIDKKRVSEIIFWVAQGFSNSVLDRIRRDGAYRLRLDMDALVAEFDQYIDLLRDAFYKK